MENYVCKIVTPEEVSFGTSVEVEYYSKNLK